MGNRIRAALSIVGLIDVAVACTYCASQDPSSNINMTLIPLGVLVCLPFAIFGLLMLYMRNQDISE